jgi:hypothetical protein
LKESGATSTIAPGQTFPRRRPGEARPRDEGTPLARAT